MLVISSSHGLPIQCPLLPIYSLWPKLACMKSAIIQYFFMFVLGKNGSWDVAVVLSRWLYLKIDLASAPKQRGAPGRTCHSRVTTSFTSPVNCARAGCPGTPPRSPRHPNNHLCSFVRRVKEKRGERIIPPPTHTQKKKNCTRSFLTAQRWDGVISNIDAHKQTVLEQWQWRFLYFI